MAALAAALALPAVLALAAAGTVGCGGAERDAERLYRDYCARCHGRDGRGIRRRDGVEAGLDLTASEVVAAGQRAEIADRIARGRGKMPGFSHRLSGEEVDRLVELVIGLSSTGGGGVPDPPAAAGPSGR